MGGNVAKVLIITAVLLAVGAMAVGAQTATRTAGGVTVSKQCHTTPCHGNAQYEIIYERVGDKLHDNIHSFGGNDRIHANTYSRDADEVRAYSGGTNYLYVDDGDTLDWAIGGEGTNYCYVDAKSEADWSCDKVIVR